jgi:hypothetical protein
MHPHQSMMLEGMTIAISQGGFGGRSDVGKDEG